MTWNIQVIRLFIVKSRIYLAWTGLLSIVCLVYKSPSLHEKKCDIIRLCYLNKTFNDGNQIAMWVKKDKGENVKVEFQFADGSSVTTSLQWVAPEDGWKYMVFDLNNPPAPVPTKDIAKPSIFKVEGQGNLVTMISELTIDNENFTQYESPKVSAQFYLVDESGEEIAFGEEFNADIFSGSLTYSVAPALPDRLFFCVKVYYSSSTMVMPAPPSCTCSS